MTDVQSLLGLSRRLIRSLLQRRADGDISGALRRKVQVHMADAVAIATAATASQPLAMQIVDAIGMGTDGGACAVLGSERRLAPSLAAFANSALIHALDFDDIHDLARLHPTAVTLPAALAAAQLVGAPVSKVIDAVALGNELMCRLGVMLRPQGQGPGADWFLTQLFGYFGAALAAGVVMTLDEDQLVAAFGFAYMQASGGKEAGFGVGCTGRSIYPAFAAMGGVVAMQLSRSGLTGPASALDGTANLFRIYLQGDITSVQAERLLAPTSWEFEATCLKPWPSCRLSHPYVAAAQLLREQLRGERLQHLEICVNSSAAKLCHPMPERCQPSTLQDAKYSVPYMTAFTLMRGEVDLAGLGLESLQDPLILDVTRKIVVSETLVDCPGHPPAQLHAVTESGRRLYAQAPVNFDMDERGVEAKFMDCFAYAGLESCASKTWEALSNADALQDVTLLVDPAAHVTAQVVAN